MNYKNKYIEERLDRQIEWYDQKSIHCKKWHDRNNIISIVLSSGSSFITLLAFAFDYLDPWLTIIDALAGIIVTSCLAIDKLKKFGDLYLTYRRTCETLKRERYLYLTKSAEYQDNINAYKLLVERCESIMATENGAWAQLNEKKKD